jgi:hypothetical protein
VGSCCNDCASSGVKRRCYNNGKIRTVLEKSIKDWNADEAPLKQWYASVKAAYLYKIICMKKLTSLIIAATIINSCTSQKISTANSQVNTLTPRKRKKDGNYCLTEKQPTDGIPMAITLL